MLRLSDIHLRDPFVVPVVEERKYYLYGTRPAPVTETGFDVYTSVDLENWEGPWPVFLPPPGFWADRQFWAPEVHRYAGRYFMFATFKAEGVCRGTQVLVSDSPKGPFQPHSDGPLTPRDWECLDGTLFVDEGGTPWMVFCHEWLQVHDGEICAICLTSDLREAAGQPILLFRASDAPWTVEYPMPGNRVTDGPFFYRAGNGDLLMLWSSFTTQGYAVGIARSSSGQLTGPWVHEPIPLYAEDGGHGSLFRTFEGQLMLEIHKPNKKPLERPLFLPVSEKEGKLRVVR